jgi:hypothetical protein
MLGFLFNVCIPLILKIEIRIGLFCLVLKSEGIFDSGNYIRQIAQTYPKFIPLLNTRIPKNLISIIWNDPVMKRLAAIFGNKQVRNDSKFFEF